MYILVKAENGSSQCCNFCDHGTNRDDLPKWLSDFLIDLDLNHVNRCLSSHIAFMFRAHAVLGFRQGAEYKSPLDENVSIKDPCDEITMCTQLPYMI
jgi:hypothetical protein